MDDLAIKPFPKEVCAMPEVLLTEIRFKMLAKNWSTRFSGGKTGAWRQKFFTEY